MTDRNYLGWNWISYDYWNSCVRLESAGQCLQMPARSLQSWIDGLCLDWGSTKEGRRLAAGRLLKNRADLPVIIDPAGSIALIVWRLKGSDALLGVRFDRIATIEPHEKSRVQVRFVDGSVLLLDSYARLKRLYLRTDYVLKALRLKSEHYSSQSSQ